MKILQAGNKVSVGAKGTRTSMPRSDDEAASMMAPKSRRTPMAVGEGNKANAAARKEAGMKAGGMVKKPGKGRYC